MINRNYRHLLVVIAPLLLWGCSGVVPLHETNTSHSINRSLSEDEIKTAILEGAKAAGWQAKELSGGRIVALFTSGRHSVSVNIFYTDRNYNFAYKDSYYMKIYCTARERDRGKKPKVTGVDQCPGGGAPVYIHSAYKRWLDNLNGSIQSSIASI